MPNESKIQRRPIADFPGYATSDGGQKVWSRRPKNGRGPLTDEWRELHPSLDPDGYLYVVLYKNGKRYNVRVHRLVAIEKYGPIPKGMQVRHLDGNKLNNHPSNLSYGSQHENAADRKRPGHDNYKNVARGERHGFAKLTEAKVRRIRDLYATGRWTYQMLADRYGVSQVTIGRIVRGEIWKHLLPQEV